MSKETPRPGQYIVKVADNKGPADPGMDLLKAAKDGKITMGDFNREVKKMVSGHNNAGLRKVLESYRNKEAV